MTNPDNKIPLNGIRKALTRGVDESAFPRKIRMDRIRCVKFPQCDEVAMIQELGPPEEK